MTEPNKLELLLQKREYLTERLSSLDEFVNNFPTDPNKSVQELQLRMHSVVQSFSNIDDVNGQIAVLDRETDHSDTVRTLADDYFKILARAHVALNNASPPAATQPSPSATNSVNSVNGVEVTSRRKIKLPQTTLPNFSGKLEEWLSFKDTFDTLIHKQDLPEVEKFHYLRSSLSGEALRKIVQMAVTEDNYRNAWNLLLRSYDDKRALVEHHMNKLLALPTLSKDDYKGMGALADEANQHVHALSSLGVAINEQVIIGIVQNKLCRTTMEKWDETLVKDQLPTFDEFVTFLHRTATRISRRKRDHPTPNERADKEQPATKKSKYEFKRHAFTLNAGKCVFCRETHQLHRCDEFIKLTVRDRFKFARKKNLCFNCLRNHKAKECTAGNCRRCGDRHNTLLHFDGTHDNKVHDGSHQTKEKEL